MLRVKEGLDEVEIRFDHRWCHPDEIEGLTGLCVEEDRRCTLVTTIFNGNTLDKGMSVCHPGDNFCRSTGRKKALAYALSPLSKSLRNAVWTEYKAKCSF